MGQYNKPFTTILEQINLLKGRGLLISDEERAANYLNRISYFRLSAYTRPFLIPNNSVHPDHQFIPGTSFEQVLELYIFDRKLRLLLLDAIERLEIALRAQVVHILAQNHGPKGYLLPEAFKPTYKHKWLIDKLKKESIDAKETFMMHYNSTYDTPYEPPIWNVSELLTFKEMYMLFSNLRIPSDIKPIEFYFRFKFPVLKSWFRHLSTLRNICAHHGRVWNRDFGDIVQPKNPPTNWPNLNEIEYSLSNGEIQQIDPTKRLYMQLVVIVELMKVISPKSAWNIRLIRLLDKYPSISRPHMGFPLNWKEDPFWCDFINK